MIHRTIPSKALSLPYLVILLSFLLGACTTTRHYSDVPYADGEDCLQDLRNPSDRKFSTPFDEVVDDDDLKEQYSTSSLRVAHAIGIVSELRELQELLLEEEPADEHRMRKMELRQLILHRVQLATLEIAGVSAALQCEQNRAYQVADHLRQKERKWERKRNVISISLSAVATLADVSFLIIPNPLVNDLVSIGTGAAIVAISLSTLRHNATATYMHEENLLQELWLGPDESEMIPSSVWYYLTSSYFGMEEERSVRQQLIHRWVQLQEVEEPDDEEDEPRDTKTRLMFTDGGVYTADELRMRAAMLEHAAAEVDLMQKKLQGLVREIMQAAE